MTPRALIVDDSLTVRMDLADVFRGAGFEVLLASDAAQARDLIRLEALDLLILDVLLPDGDGIEILGEVRDTEDGKELAIMMLSSEAEVADRVRGMRMGADEYVGKPYDVNHVLTRARELVAARRSSMAASAPAAAPVLLIDDSATFRGYIGEALRERGYHVATASTGEEGLRLAAAQRPAAILVDGVLPGIDGATVIRRVRLDAALRSVPCILLTAALEAEAELRALDSGADAFVRKDEDPSLILAKLAALLRSTESSDRTLQTASLLAHKKILAVDDSATYRAELAKILEADGYEIILARSGEEAIELLSVQSVDCVLLDLIMDGISGTETCRLIKSSPGLRDLPVMLLTSVEDRASMLEAMASGADDYIAKSAEFTVLKARVRAQLRRRQFEDETRRVREQLLRSQSEAAAARSARELAETRALLVEQLERKNGELETAYRELQTAQSQLVQSAKMASLGELVAGVAHEINNPLAFVLSHLDTTRRSLAKAAPAPEHMTQTAKDNWERALSRLQEMNLGLDRIQELVVKLRTFSRLDEGEQKTVSIRECVESLLTILGHKLKDRIAVETHFGEPDQLDCFPSLLTQAIMNLVSNSIDAIDGQGRIDIRTGAAEGGYRIVVTDSGHGIPPHLQERVIEPFFTTKPIGQGTGLGLSIVYSIVRKHGGTLELTDAVGGGTRAVIHLPAKHPGGDFHDARSESEETTSSTRR
ncbi:MAG TPA: response regulator [Polyangiales bacterium]|nr:response regulator [Polyangiales bacterium]